MGVDKRLGGRVGQALFWLWLASLGGLPAYAITLWKYPYLQDLRRTGVVVMWSTVENGAGAVQFSTDRSFSRSVTAQSRTFTRTETTFPTTVTQYEANLTGLEPDTQYFYRVMVDGQDLAPNDSLTFRTQGPGPFTFLAFGDSGMATLEQSQIATRMSLETTQFVLHTGDIAYYSGTYDEFQFKHFNFYKFLMNRIPFYPVAGNHEYITNRAEPFLAQHSFPGNGTAADRNRYYSFDWGNVHFVAIDANLHRPPYCPPSGCDPALGPAFERMLKWLDEDLTRNRSFWRVAYWHQPPYGYGPNEADPLERQARDFIVPILEKHDVQLVLNGHEHSYQRSRFIREGQIVDVSTCPIAISPPPESNGVCPAQSGILYITTGGGGANLYAVPTRAQVAFGMTAHHYLKVEVNGGKMKISPISVDGFLIEPPAVLSPVPLLQPNSTVNAASFAPGLAPGALVSIFGRFLSLNEAGAPALPLPPSLGGAQVTLNGRRLPLLYVSRNQINTQLPFDAPTGPATLRVTTVNGFAESTVDIVGAAPGIFFSGSNPAVLHQNGRLVTAASPAVPGEFVSIYMTGLGSVVGTVVSGEAAPASPLAPCRAPVRVSIAGTEVIPTFAGLAPGFTGLYQVDVQVPASIPAGLWPLKVRVSETDSNQAQISVQTQDPTTNLVRQ